MFSGSFPGRKWGCIPLVCVVLLGGIVGCGGSDPYEAVPVSGKVTFDDGSRIPVGRMTLTFTSQTEAVDNKTHPRPAQAEINVTDGTFSAVTTLKAGDGLIPGKHKVEGFTYDGNGNPVPMAILPTEIEVSDGSVVFEFKVPKPK